MESKKTNADLLKQFKSAIGFIKDLKTDNIIPIYGRNLMAQYETNLINLKKQRQEHLKRFVPLTESEKKEFLAQFEPKKPGRKPAEK